ncbi:MAG: biopolymer transporter ExbD [Bacteroidetes bacterium]|nr:MAG: biopolymer transporter ExbD [Bacteroidota bacterium]TAG86908.1 MAG: biopolymer transporter ExbD [Bacteroidota bacterium]
MKKRKSEGSQEINASSMADIAFLLLIFFLVTTTIASDKGLTIVLPPKKDDRTKVETNERNVYVVLVNSRNQLLVEGQGMDPKDLREGVKKFLLNYGADKKSSDNPRDAAVSFKTDRATKHSMYMQVYDEIIAAYNEIRAEKLGMTMKDYMNFDKEKAKKEPALIQKAQLFAQKTDYVDEDIVDNYLAYDVKTIDKRKQKMLDAFVKARNSSKLLFVEKYYDIQKEFPKRISKAEPTKVE